MHAGDPVRGSVNRAAVIVAVMATFGCGRDAPKDRRAALAQQLRTASRTELPAAAAAYRAALGEEPAVVREIADAYARVGDRDGELATLRPMIEAERGAPTDVRRALDLMLDAGPIDDATYQRGRSLLQQLLRAEPWCASYDLLVRWTEGHPEHPASLDQALAGCPRDEERARWLTARRRDAANACDAVVRGALTEAMRCVEGGGTSWQVLAARGVLGERPGDNLRAAAASPDATAFLLLQVARLADTPRDQACAALTRARAIEQAWLPKAGAPAAIAGRYDQLNRNAGCQ